MRAQRQGQQCCVRGRLAFGAFWADRVDMLRPRPRWVGAFGGWYIRTRTFESVVPIHSLSLARSLSLSLSLEREGATPTGPSGARTRLPGCLDSAPWRDVADKDSAVTGESLYFSPLPVDEKRGVGTPIATKRPHLRACLVDSASQVVQVKVLLSESEPGGKGAGVDNGQTEEKEEEARGRRRRTAASDRGGAPCPELHAPLRRAQYQQQ
jgi:hypothetical protein